MRTRGPSGGARSLPAPVRGAGPGAGRSTAPRLALGLGLAAALAAACGAPRGSAPVRLPRTPGDRVARVRPLVERASRRHAVPQDLILAVILVESGFRPQVCSGAGACGLMQLMPRTAASLARRLGWKDHDRSDPEFNIEAGTAYLGYLLDRFDGDLRLALAAYNAGPANAARYHRRGRIPGQVRRYVAAVQAARGRFQRRPGAPAPTDALPASGPTGGAGQALARGEPAELDRAGLRSLLQEKAALYGERPDVALDEMPPR